MCVVLCDDRKTVSKAAWCAIENINGTVVSLALHYDAFLRVFVLLFAAAVATPAPQPSGRVELLMLRRLCACSNENFRTNVFAALQTPGYSNVVKSPHGASTTAVDIQGTVVLPLSS